MPGAERVVGFSLQELSLKSRPEKCSDPSRRKERLLRMTRV